MFLSPTQLLRDSSPHVPRRTRNRGYSLLELMGVVAIAMIMAGMALPIIKSSLQMYRSQAAVNSITGAIAATRYRAITDGCPYQVAFASGTNTYQVSTMATGSACAATFSATGTAMPFGYTSQVKLNADITFQFSPGGSVTVSTGSLPIAVSTLNASGSTISTKNIQVTSYGSVTVQ